MFTGKTKQVDESPLKDVFQFHGEDLYKAKTLWKYKDQKTTHLRGKWAKVQMLGWVPKAQIAPAAPEGVRLEGSPGGGIWVSSVRIQKDFLGDAQVTGWVTNATGKDFKMLMLEAVLVDSSGDVIDAVPILISHIPEGASKGFAAETAVPFGQVAEVIFQFSAAL